MAKNNRYQKPSAQTQEDGLKAAKATQRPGQTKEQTKLIALGIEKGINHYKKQQKEKSRELNRKLLKASKAVSKSDDIDAVETQVKVVYKQAVLPWLLLLVSWLIFAAYLYI